MSSFPGLDLHSLYTDPAPFITTADTKSTVDDLYDLYDPFDLYDPYDLYDMYDIYDLHDADRNLL